MYTHLRTSRRSASAFHKLAHANPNTRTNEVLKESGPYRIGTELPGRGGFKTPDLTQYDETDDDTLVAGQATAIGLSIHGISKAQLETLKARMENTKTKLEAAQLAQQQNTPQGTQAAQTALQGLTGDTLTGDILTANVWSWFADLQSHGRIASSQAKMIDLPALSYGMFHARGQPIKLFGLTVTQMKLTGVMMDIGHVRHQRWVQDDNPQAQINQPASGSTLAASAMPKQRWIAYNRMRGQYASALEHAIPERFFNDTTQCNAPGKLPNLNSPACSEAISAVKAISIAQSKGQKVFTVTQFNVNAVLPQLQHSVEVREDVLSAVQAGKEVTIHEASISAYGFSGAGYTVIDPETGSGGYLIEGGARGGLLAAIGTFGFGLYWMLYPLFALASLPTLIGILLILSILLIGITIAIAEQGSVSRGFLVNVGYGLLGAGLVLGLAGTLPAVGVGALIELAVILALSYANAVIN